MSLRRVIVVGNVDDGKSTLVGRLLFESRQVAEDQLSSLEKLSRARGGGELDLTLLTDGLRAEREQGVTIDVAYRHFAVGDQRFLLIDAPGHVQYTRNMFTGCTNADTALILVDVSRGFTDQTFRHGLICGMLGVRDVVLVLNKMDLNGFSREVFENFLSEARRRLEGIVQLREVIPVSALKGDNVTEKSPRMPWYSGSTLLEALKKSGGEVTATEDSRFAMPVQGVEAVRSASGGWERWITGRVWSGALRVGDRVRIQPTDCESEVVAIGRGGDEVSEAASGDSISLRLREDVEVSRGDLLTHAEFPLKIENRLRVRLFWMSKAALRTGHPYTLLLGRRQMQVMLSEVEAVYNVQELATRASTSLHENDIALATMTSAAPMMVASYGENRQLGSFVIVDPASKNSVAGGIVISTQ